MLQFKPRQFEREELPPRWNIGVDRLHVIAYVGLAVIAGFAGGFLAGRYTIQKEASAPLPISQTPPAPRQAFADAPSGFHRVTRIVRADTIDVESVGTVRMIGIETPDGKSPREIYGVHGQRALSFAEKTLLSQEVRLELDATDGRTNDDSGETLAYVYTRDGTLINGEMVKQGLALVRSKEQFKLASDFRGYEREAMQSMRGVWGSSSSSASALASSTPTTVTPAQPSAEDKPKKLSPLPPSAFGVNVPALSGSTSTPGEPSVWVSPGDKMYHKSGCEFLDKKKHSVGLSQAKSEGYTACSRCYASTVLKAP